MPRCRNDALQLARAVDLLYSKRPSLPSPPHAHLVDDRVGDVYLEGLQPQDALLERAAHYQAVHVDGAPLADAVREAKEGRVFLGTPGIGSGSHIAAEYFFKVLAKHDVKHIPFPGGSPAKQGLLSGDVTVLAATATTGIIPSILSGEISGLAVASSERDPAIPAVPTFAELGYPDFLASSWVGFFAPSATPRPILERLNSAINDVLKDADVRSKFEGLGTLLVSRSLDESQGFFKDEVARWAKMVQATGLSM